MLVDFQCLGITILAAAKKWCSISFLIDLSDPGSIDNRTTSEEGVTEVAMSLKYRSRIVCQNFLIRGHSHQMWSKVPLDVR